MSQILTGKRIAFLATDGVEQVELTEPWSALRDAGAETVLVSLDDQEKVQGFDHLTPADTFDVDASVGGADAASYDALVLPGGVANPDALRGEPDAVEFIRAFADQGKPIAAICHAPWTLIEAGLVDGRRITSWPSLKTDLTNAGATWVDEETVCDGGILTSRNPDDLPAFGEAAIRLFAGSQDE